MSDVGDVKFMKTKGEPLHLPASSSLVVLIRVVLIAGRKRRSD